MDGIGLFGGTFNPIHMGHLKVARDVKAGFQLEKVYLIPCALPPHKGTAALADAKDRLRMIEVAIEKEDDFAVSDVEIRRKGVSYSIDTVLWFQHQIPPDQPCFLIMGMDAFLEIDTWKSFQTFFDVIPMIVMTRPLETRDPAETGKPGETTEKGKQTQNPRLPSKEAESLETYIHLHVDPHYSFEPASSCFVHPRRRSVYLYHVTPIPVSATQIRERVRRKAKITGLVPASVEKYILEKGLYV